MRAVSVTLNASDETFIRAIAQNDRSAARVAVEGEFLERNNLRRAPEAKNELAANDISTLLQRIDLLIAELQTLRDPFRQEGIRVQREIAKYSELSQSVMRLTKVIGESLGRQKIAGKWPLRTGPR